MSYLPTGADPSGTGVGPAIQGDPTIALLAQLNRFAGKEIAPAPGAAARHYVSAPFALDPTALNNRATTAAASILIDRYQYAPINGYDKGSASWAINGSEDPDKFVPANLETITAVIALYGDKLGLAPAVTGITTRDPRFVPTIPWVKIGLVAIGIAVVLKLRKKGRR